MTDSKAIATSPVWVDPDDFKDNTIIQAYQWNRIASNIGSVGWLKNATYYRSACNIAVAEWKLQSIPSKNSTTSNSTTIIFSDVSNGKFFKPKGAIYLPDDVPCLLIWKVWFYGEVAFTNYNLRTTLLKTYYSKNGKTINRQTVASHFSRKYDPSQVVMSASYATIASASTDRYYITVDHGYHSAINTRGYCHLITRPGMV